MTLFALNEEQARILGAVCEAVVPGSQAVAPVVYIDSVAAEMPPPQREALLGAISSLEPVLEAGESYLEEAQFMPAFQWVRALALEAYYSDFRPPGYAGPTAWDEIDFNSPLARRLDKDWSFLRCYR
jgi:hypothetical protein